MSVDGMTLIEQVEQRPPLWDRLNPDHTNKRVTTALWHELARIHPGCSVETVKSRWKNLRDTYRMEMRKDYSTWIYFQHMTFLKNQVKPRVSLPYEPLDSPYAHAPVSSYAADKIVDVKIKCEASEPPDDEVPAHEDEPADDYHFLMSFLPELKKLDTQKKMLLRIKMMELVYREIYDPNYLRPDGAPQP